MLPELAVALLLIGLTAYVVLGGADFGAGFWDLTAGGAERGAPVRAMIKRAMSPVWEANHVWLIFVLVVLWTAFPPVFAAIASTLYIPLTLAAVGIIARGAAFAFRKSVEELTLKRLCAFNGFPQVGFCQAGEEAQPLHAQLQGLLTEAEDVPLPVHAFLEGDLAGLAIGYAPGEARHAHTNRERLELAPAPGQDQAAPHTTHRTHGAQQLVQGDQLHDIGFAARRLLGPPELRAQLAHDGQAARHHRRVRRQPPGLGQDDLHLCAQVLGWHLMTGRDFVELVQDPLQRAGQVLTHGADLLHGPMTEVDLAVVPDAPDHQDHRRR
jgi:hypothetical protein